MILLVWRKILYWKMSWQALIMVIMIFFWLQILSLLLLVLLLQLVHRRIGHRAKLKFPYLFQLFLSHIGRSVRHHLWLRWHHLLIVNQIWILLEFWVGYRLDVRQGWEKSAFLYVIHAIWTKRELLTLFGRSEFALFSLLEEIFHAFVGGMCPLHLFYLRWE